MVGAPTFFVVGAQKAGTTSLHQYLAGHPEVFVPPQKESEFFYRDDLYDRGFTWYCDTFFAGAKPSQICGEVCPQYMFSEQVPTRIHAVAPHARIIMLLRNPVERAHSHYRMSERRGRERRTFDQMLNDELAAARAGRAAVTPDFGYLSFGEYGRILRQYLRVFSRDSIKVMFAEDLAAQRQSAFRDLADFIGVDSSFVPASLQKDFNVGGEKRFALLDSWARRHALPKRLLRGLLGDMRYTRLWLWYETEFGVAKKSAPRMSDDSAARLRDYFVEDVRTLEQLLGCRVPWRNFADDSAGA